MTWEKADVILKTCKICGHTGENRGFKITIYSDTLCCVCMAKKKQEFIAEYEALCEKVGLCIVISEWAHLAELRDNTRKDYENTVMYLTD